MSTTNPTWPLPEPDAIGPVLGADDARDALRATIERWSPFYLGVLSKRLAAAERIGGPGQPPNPLPLWGKWRNEPTFRSLSGPPAAFLVTVAATVGKPHIKGTGATQVVYRAQVRAQVFGTTWQEAADLTSWYEKVVRLCVMQHRSLDGLASAPTNWAGTSYASIEHTSSRTIWVATLGFDVTLANVMNAMRGPSVPPPTGTPGQDPTVDDVILDLTRVPVTSRV